MNTEPTIRSAGATDNLYLSDVLLLCAECKQPIKARINTAQWLRVEWISPEGTCQGCWNTRKEKVDASEAKEEVAGGARLSAD